MKPAIRLGKFLLHAECSHAIADPAESKSIAPENLIASSFCGFPNQWVELRAL